MSSINTAGTTSFVKTSFNAMNALSGVGILSIPYALSSGGWCSICMFLLIAACTLYTGLLIQRCMKTNPNLRTFADIGERAYGNRGKILVLVMTNTELFLVATAFLILVGENLHKLFPNMNVRIIRGVGLTGQKGFTIIAGTILLPVVWIRYLNLLSYVSASGVMASLVLLGSIAWTAASDDFEFRGDSTSVFRIRGIPEAMSLYAFCYCAHMVFPTLYTSMRNPKQFSKVLIFSFVTSTVLYFSVAVLGYMMFGSNIATRITLNLETHRFCTKVAIWTTIFNPVAKYPLMMAPIVQALENRFHWNQRMILCIMLRTVVVITTIAVAVVVPHFEDLVALVGAVLSVTVSIILPCACYLKITGAYMNFGVETLTIYSIAVLGGLVSVLGTFNSMADIIKQIS